MPSKKKVNTIISSPKLCMKSHRRNREVKEPFPAPTGFKPNYGEET